MLHWIGDHLRSAFLLVPLWVAKGLFLGVFFALMVWVVQLPRSAATPSANSPWHEDLRIWAWLALFIQLLAYGLL
jgi:heme/copper-type cytochrome/quinol oxidase subunit 2